MRFKFPKMRFSMRYILPRKRPKKEHPSKSKIWRSDLPPIDESPAQTIFRPAAPVAISERLIRQQGGYNEFEVARRKRMNDRKEKGSFLKRVRKKMAVHLENDSVVQMSERIPLHQAAQGHHAKPMRFYPHIRLSLD